MAEHVVTMEICRFLALIEKAQMVIEDHIYELNKITVCLKTFDTPTSPQATNDVIITNATYI